MTPDLLTVKDVAAKLSVSGRYVRKLLADGTLPAYKIGRNVRIPDSALAEFLEQRLLTTQRASQNPECSLELAGRSSVKREE